jgi:hypothetical protein
LASAERVQLIIVFIHTSTDSAQQRGDTLAPHSRYPMERVSLFVAFLALVVRFTGSHLWGIVCFACHQLRTIPTEQDDVYHHNQVLLRNSESESTTLWEMALLWWARKRGNRLLQCLPVVLVAILHMTALTAARLVSSKFIAVDDEVLARGPACGCTHDLLVGGTSLQEMDIANALLVSGHVSYRKSVTYSRACYGSDGTTFPYVTNSSDHESRFGE